MFDSILHFVSEVKNKVVCLSWHFTRLCYSFLPSYNMFVEIPGHAAYRLLGFSPEEVSKRSEQLCLALNIHFHP